MRIFAMTHQISGAIHGQVSAPSTQNALIPVIRAKIDTYTAQRLENVQTKMRDRYGRLVENKTSIRKAREELRNETQQDIESRIRELQDELDTVRESASDLVTNATCSVELPGLISTKKERAILKT